MSRILHSVLCPLILAILITGAGADTITLKNGEHLEGKVTKETDKDITVEVKISAGITDERVLPRSDIQSVEKVSPEILAYKAVSAIQLGVDSLPVAQYDAAIGALRAFVKQYPNSTHIIGVKTILRSFEQEQQRVANGEVKLDGTWLSKEQLEKEKIQVGARLAFSYMKGQNAAGDYIGAMVTFDALEKAYPGAAVMPNAIDLARQILPALKTSVEKIMANGKAFRTDRAKRVAGDNPVDRKQVKGAIKQEQTDADALVDAAEKAGNWPPLLPNNEKSVSAVLKHADKEATRLAALPVDKMKQSLRLTEQAKQNLDTGDAKTAVETLKQATLVWPANERAQRMAKETAADQKAASASTAPGTPTPSPTKAK